MLGQADCPCLNVALPIDTRFGSQQCAGVGFVGLETCIPPEFGTYCRAWDDGQPTCNRTSLESHLCLEKWCYVDERCMQSSVTYARSQMRHLEGMLPFNRFYSCEPRHHSNQ
eukprot:90873-Prymnesium_polylepis.2